ncbi:hypothetical protein D3C79_910690 [compost metagenome]
MAVAIGGLLSQILPVATGIQPDAITARQAIADEIEHLFLLLEWHVLELYQEGYPAARIGQHLNRGEIGKVTRAGEVFAQGVTKRGIQLIQLGQHDGIQPLLHLALAGRFAGGIKLG